MSVLILVADDDEPGVEKLLRRYGDGPTRTSIGAATIESCFLINTVMAEVGVAWPERAARRSETSASVRVEASGACSGNGSLGAFPPFPGTAGTGRCRPSRQRFRRFKGR